jgi:large subunit ribosomal protein L32
MALPKRRTSSTVGKQRRTHWKLKTQKGFGVCPNPDCRQPVIQHQACPACGQYRGRQVITIKDKSSKQTEEN